MGSKGYTQQDLADALATEFHLSGRTSRLYVQRLLDLVADGLVEKGRLELRGLGIFAVHVRPSRQTTHPGTGKPITIPEKRAVRYRSSAALRRRLNPPGTRRRKRLPKAQ
ncbi:MAG: Integration host factor subunit beta [Steroidobacteraceae bacterium]|nr:Integration host factor subunit beta [Steroidobacteraceae bacterium]